METTQQSRVTITRKRTRALWNGQGQPFASPNGAFLSSSIICGDPLNYLEELKLLESARVDMLHMDVMDGVFVPRIGQYPELIHSFRKRTNLPIDVHLMLSQPEQYLSTFVDAGADILTIHAEATSQTPRLLRYIRHLGVKSGLALNPATPIEMLEYVLDDIDVVMLMTINPGSVGESMKPSVLKKIQAIRKLIIDRKEKAHIMMDGNTNLENSIKMVKAGASILVSGTSSIYKQKDNLEISIRSFRKELMQGLK